MSSPPEIDVKSPPPFRAWLVVTLLAGVACLNYIDRVMLTTMRQSIVEAIPMSDAQFGLLTSTFLWVYAFMSPVGGYLADRVSRTKVIIGSLFLWSAVTWLTAHVTTFNGLILTRVLMGFSEACYIPAALALISDYHRGPTRSLATGIHRIGISAGQGLGGLGGFLAEKHHWSYAFNLFGVIGVAYSVLLLTILRDVAPVTLAPGTEAPRPVKFRQAVISLFKSPAYRLALIFWGLASVGSWAVIGWLPTLLCERFQLSQDTAGLSATGYLQPAAWIGPDCRRHVVRLCQSAESEGSPLRHHRGTLHRRPCIYIGANSTVFWTAIAGFMIWSFGLAFVNANMMPILCLIADERHRATGYGILNLCSTSIGRLHHLPRRRSARRTDPRSDHR